MLSEVEHLQKIANLASEVLSSIEVIDERQLTSPRHRQFPPVMFTTKSCEDFEPSFRHLELSKTLQYKLEELFRQKIDDLRQKYQASFTNLLDSQIYNSSKISIISNLMTVGQNFLDENIARLHDQMMKLIQSKVTDFRVAVDCSCDVESSSESSVAQKGHSPRAIAILEKVFVRTTNINRSEKLQLAKATKLEPRQVTIWFQNRRNRKPTTLAQSGHQSQKKPSTLIQQRKRKFDSTEDKVPQTPKQRRRLSETDIVSLTSPSSFGTETPFSSSTCDRSSSVELFEISQTSTRSNGGTSCGTSYDDSFSSFQSEDSSPPRSTFGMNSFDDQIVRFTNAKKTGRSGDDKKEMMFNENGEVVLDWDDLELNLEDFNDSVSQVATPNFTFPTDKQLDGVVGDVTLLKTHQETNDLILSFARQLVEEDFSAQQNLEQVQESEGWQVQAFDKIFLTKGPEQDIISLTDLQSSQSSNPSGPSTSNSTQTSPRSGTPRSLFNFDFEGLGLDDIMAHNNKSIQQNIDSVNLFAPDEMPNFEPATSDILGLLFSPTPASSSTDA